jgi:hypothetical protein
LLRFLTAHWSRDRQRSYYLAQWQNSALSLERQQEYYQLFYEAQEKLREIDRQWLFSISDLLALE